MTGHALVQRRCGVMSSMRPRPVEARAARLLDQQAIGLASYISRRRPGFAGSLAVARIHEHAAAHQDAMHFGDHRCDPAHVEVALAHARCAPALHSRDVALHGRLPEALVAAVDREFARVLGNAHAGCVSTKLPISRSSVKPCVPLADGQHEHRGRAIDRVAGGDLAAARLQEMRRLPERIRCLHGAAPRKSCRPTC